MTPIPKPAHPIRMVVCAANRNVRTGQLALGPRHFDPSMRRQIDAYVTGELTLRPQLGMGDRYRQEWRTANQGFIDQHGQFMTREEAWVVALAAGQVRYGPHLAGGRLDSSDLY